MSQSGQSSLSLSTSSKATKQTMEAHQLPRECYPPTDSDDESFVVLETDCDGQHSPSIPAMPISDIPSLLQSDIIDASLEEATEAIMKSLTLQSLPIVPKMDASFAAASFDSTATTDELQQRIEMLIEENRKLSDSLNQNNIVMKNQFETLSKWQEDVERVHESHKQKFAETKEYIKQLQQENSKLKKMMQSSTNSLNASIISMSHVTTAKPEEKPDMEDMATSMESLKLLQTAKETIAAQTQEMVTLKANVATLTANNSLANAKELEEAKEKIAAQTQEIDALKANMATLTADNSLANAKELEKANEKIAELTLEIDALKANTTTLSTVNSLQSVELYHVKQELTVVKDGNSKQSCEMDVLKNELENEKSLIIEKSNDADILKAEIQRLNDELIALKQLNDAQKSELDAKSLLGEQLHDFKKQVEHNDDENNLLKLENLEASKKEQKLLEDVMALKCQLVKLRNGETAEVQQLRIQLSSAQCLITELKESKKIVEKEAQQNRETIDEMDKKMKDVVSDKDKIMALEHQLVIYRGDFESERELKIRSIEELNHISEDLSKVQQRNRELVDEIDELRRVKEEYVEVPHPAGRQKTPSPPLTQFSCPLCAEKFRSLRAVEEHVDMCINNAP